MSINRINGALWEAMERDSPLTDGTVFACHATEEEWDAFVVSEDQVLKSKYLEWFEASEEIHIVEFPSAAHASLVGAVRDSFRAHANAKPYLRCRGDAFNQEGLKFEPDVQFGPARHTPGSMLPRPGLAWRDFNTIKVVEIGVLQPWGDRAGQLDYKALSIWYAIWYATLGVEYVLCIKADDALASAEFKLYDFQDAGRRHCPEVQQTAIPIIQGTTVAFDAHRILGIPSASSLPAGFPDPFVFDLDEALQDARVDM